MLVCKNNRSRRTLNDTVLMRTLRVMKFHESKSMTSTNASKSAEGFRVVSLSHVNVTVPAEAEAAAKTFYETVLGLKEIPKPAGTRQNLGAWYELGALQLHLSVEEKATNAAS